jgi:alkylated DNA repair dioxygenase AlkB
MASASASAISGLDYVPDFVGEEHELILLDNIQKSEWNTTLSRRTQHYGWTYPYGSSSKLVCAPPIPSWMFPLKSIVEEYFGYSLTFDQVIVNEYEPGQGIAPHIDDPKLFGDTIVSVSLGSGVEMDFTKKDNTEKTSIYLSRKSMLVLKGDARYEYRHSISKRKSDHKLPRGTRISITFRMTKHQGV